MKTQLQDRTLWHDGCISVTPDELENFIGYDDVYVTEINQDIKQYNKIVPTGAQFEVKTQLYEISTEWNIPEEYLKLKISDYVLDKYYEETKEGFTEEEISIRAKRIVTELRLFAKHDLTRLIQTLIYIINTFQSKNVVWGPGRGSSVSSYILYLIGVHDVDSVTFDLDITDFIRDKGE